MDAFRQAAMMMRLPADGRLAGRDGSHFLAPEYSQAAAGYASQCKYRRYKAAPRPLVISAAAYISFRDFSSLQYLSDIDGSRAGRYWRAQSCHSSLMTPQKIGVVATSACAPSRALAITLIADARRH